MSNNDVITSIDYNESDEKFIKIRQLFKDELKRHFSVDGDNYDEIIKYIFEGVFKFAGKIRTYNITKKEWVLNGDTVYYSDFEMIKQSLDYDFSQESKVDYNTFSPEESVKHFTRFIIPRI